MTEVFPSSDELEAVIENGDSSSFTEFAHALLSACADWPTFNLKEPSDLIRELAREVPGQLTQSSIERFFKFLPTSQSENWPHKLEACVSILELFRCANENDRITIEQLVLGQWSKYKTEREVGK